MSNTKKICVVAAVLILLGLILFAAVMTVYRWDFGRLNTGEYVTNTHEIAGDFDGIVFDMRTADIALAVSDDGVCKVVCYESEDDRHRIEVRERTLFVSADSDNSRFFDFNVQIKPVRITLYLPKTDYASLAIDEHTGDISIPKGFTFDTADLSVTTGEISFAADVRGTAKLQTTTGGIRVESASVGELSLIVTTGDAAVIGTVCGCLYSDGSTGDISLRNAIAEKDITVCRTTGSVTLSGADAAELHIKTTTGDITGTLLTDKIYIAEAATGSVRVPNTISGGICEAQTTTGKICLSKAE